MDENASPIIPDRLTLTFWLLMALSRYLKRIFELILGSNPRAIAKASCSVTEADFKRSNRKSAKGSKSFTLNPHIIINGLKTPNDSLYNEQWYHHKVKAYEAWTNYDPEANIILAIIDTGIDYYHPDLEGSFWLNIPEDLNGNGILDSMDINNFDDDGNGYIDDIIGWDFTDAPRFPDTGDYSLPDNDPMDFHGHGTSVAGIMGAVGNNGIGVTGVAWNIAIMPLKVGLDSSFSTELSVSGFLEAVEYAINNGARIINASFGGIGFSRAERDVISLAHQEGIIMTFPAGNFGNTNEEPDLAIFPASYNLPNIISVAATSRARGFSEPMSKPTDRGSPVPGPSPSMATTASMIVRRGETY